MTESRFKFIDTFAGYLPENDPGELERFTVVAGRAGEPVFILYSAAMAEKGFYDLEHRGYVPTEDFKRSGFSAVSQTVAKHMYGLLDGWTAFAWSAGITRTDTATEAVKFLGSQTL